MPSGVKYFALLPLLMAVGTPVSGRVPLSCSPGPYILFFGHRSVKLNERSRWVLDNAVKQRGDCGETGAGCRIYRYQRTATFFPKAGGSGSRLYDQTRDAHARYYDPLVRQR
jgi:hypothetical protein